MKHILLPAIYSIVLLSVQAEPSEPVWKNYINHQNINCLYPDGSDLWIGTKDAGLVRRNCITGEEIVFDKDGGFFSDQIIAIVKDSGNAIWAASPYNIARFKNDSWVVMDIFDSNIKGLTADSSGAVWIACSNGIGRQSGDGFIKSSAFDSIKKTDEYPISIFSSTFTGKIYVLVKNSIHCFNLEGSHYRTIDIPFDLPMSICVDQSNRLFTAGVDTVGIYENDSWHFFSGTDDGLSSSVLQLSVSAQGDVWAFGGGDVFAFVENKWELRHKYAYGDGIISTIAPLTKDSAWFGRPCYLALKTSDTLKVIPDDAPGGNEIKFVFADKDGTVWTQASDDIGILRLIDNKWNFNGLFYTLGNKTISMLHTSDSVYWFLQPRDVKNYLLRINGGIQRSITRSAYIPDGTLNDFIEDAAGVVWFATSNGVVTDSTLMTYTKENAGFTSNNINTLLLRKDKTIWAGGNDGTLAFFKDGVWTSQSISINSSISVLAEDSSGDLWIGTKDGVINKKGTNETVFTVSEGLGSNIITDILVDKDNNVWVGTYNGLTCFTAGRLAKTFKRPCGISGNTITSLCQDRNNLIWIGTDRGISTLAAGTSSIKEKSQMKRSLHGNGAHTFLKQTNRRTSTLGSGKSFLLDGKKAEPPSGKETQIPRMIKVHVPD